MKGCKNDERNGKTARIGKNSHCRRCSKVLLCALLFEVGCSGDASRKVMVPQQIGRPSQASQTSDERIAVQPVGALRMLASDHAAVVVVVGTDCPISNGCQPEIERLRARFAPRDIDFLQIYAELPITAEEVQTHVRMFGIRCATAIDRDRSVQRVLGAKTVPEAFVLSRAQDDGTRALLYRGRIDDRYPSRATQLPSARHHDLEVALTAVAEGKDPPIARTRAVGCVLGQPDSASPLVVDPVALLRAQCLPCHYAEGSAPFALDTADAIHRKSATISAVLRDGLMPPHIAQTGGPFVLPTLTSDEREALAQWAADGAPDIPDVLQPIDIDSPKPDARRIRIASEWVVPADGVFMRTFTAPADQLPERIRAIDLRRASFAVERAMLSIDPTGTLRALDAQDFGDGAHVRADAPHHPAGSLAMIGVDSAFRLPSGWCIERSSGDLAVELHAVGRGAPASGAVELAFDAAMPSDRVANCFLAGAEGALASSRERTTIRIESSPLVQDVSVVALGLRVDERCAAVDVVARSASGNRRVLLGIPHYREGFDREWRFEQLVDLSAGTTIEMTVQYGDELAARLAQPMVILWAGIEQDPSALAPINGAIVEAVLMPADVQELSTQQGITWFEAVQACNVRSVRDNLTPAYAIAHPRHVQGRLVNAMVSGVPNANGWRLQNNPATAVNRSGRAEEESTWSWTGGAPSLTHRTIMGGGKADALPPSAQIPGVWAHIERPK